MKNLSPTSIPCPACKQPLLSHACNGCHLDFSTAPFFCERCQCDIILGHDVASTLNSVE